MLEVVRFGSLVSMSCWLKLNKKFLSNRSDYWYIVFILIYSIMQACHCTGDCTLCPLASCVLRNTEDRGVRYGSSCHCSTTHTSKACLLCSPAKEGVRKRVLSLASLTLMRISYGIPAT